MKQIITISREFGSGGRLLAQMVAEKLGIPFYDRQIIKMVAEKSGICLDIVEETGEYKASNWFLGTAIPNVYTGNVMDMLSPIDRVYIFQSEVINSIAAQGPCVIVGRSANYILKDRTDVLNVFIHSDEAHKLERIAEVNGLAEKEARKLMEKKDKQRASHVKHYTDQIWGQLRNYHLTLDSGALGLDKCCELIIKASKD